MVYFYKIPVYGDPGDIARPYEIVFFRVQIVGWTIFRLSSSTECVGIRVSGWIVTGRLAYFAALKTNN